MSETNLANLQAVWRELSQRNDWMLAADEAAFLRDAGDEFAKLAEDTPADKRARMAILRAYGVLLHSGLRDRQERAAYELWLACYRLALRGGCSASDAEVLAQETIARVLEKLHTLRTPHSIISWSIRIFRTVRAERTRRRQAEESLPTGDEPAMVLTDTADVAAEVEQRLLVQQLDSLLRAKLPNTLERQVLLRIVIWGDQPRDVARDLGLPLHRTRLAKSRALKRLRDDKQFLQILDDLAGVVTQQPVHTGVFNDERGETRPPRGGSSAQGA